MPDRLGSQHFMHDAYPGASPHLVGQTKRRHRTQGAFRQLQPHEEGSPPVRHETHSSSLPATSTTCVHNHGVANGGANSFDQGHLSLKGPPASNHIEHGGASRQMQDHTTSDGHRISSKVRLRFTKISVGLFGLRESSTNAFRLLACWGRLIVHFAHCHDDF